MNKFTFHQSYYEAIKDMPKDIQGEVLTAIIEYDLNGVTTEQLKPIAKAIVTLIKFQIDTDNQSIKDTKKPGNPNFKKGQANPYQHKLKHNSKIIHDNYDNNNSNNNNNNGGDNPPPQNTSYSSALLNDPHYLEVTAMQLKTNVETVKNYLDKFLKHLIQLGENKQTEREFKQHFTFWLNKQNIKTITPQKAKMRYV